MDKLQNKEVSKGLRRNRQLLRAGMDFGYSVSLASRPCMLIFLINGLKQNSHLPEWKLRLLCSEPTFGSQVQVSLPAVFISKQNEKVYIWILGHDCCATDNVSNLGQFMFIWISPKASQAIETPCTSSTQHRVEAQ